MAISSFVGSFNAGVGAAASTVAVTGVGFTPEVIIFWWSGRSEAVDTIGRASHYRGFGVAVSPTDRRAIASSSIDALTSSDSQTGHDEAACILSVDATPANDGAIDLQSFDADGFTLVVDDQMPRDLRVHFMALAGDITNAVTGRLTEPNAVGDQDITSLAFQPDFVLFFSMAAASNPPGTMADSVTMIGAAVSPTGQGVTIGVSNSGSSTMLAQSYSTSGECIVLPNTAVTAITSRADFVSFLSNGFRVNWVESAGSRRIHYLALKGGNYRVDNLLTQTDTVTDIAESGFGFSPSAAMFVSHSMTESTSDTLQANDKMSIGAFSNLTNRGAQAMLDENGTADSEITTAIEFDAIYANISAASAIDGLMDVKSVDSDGFTMIMDDADPSQAFVWYMAFGPGGVQAYTMTAAQGNYALSGQASNLLFGRKLTAVQGSYALTGQLASLIAARKLTALQGSYVLSGQVASLLSVISPPSERMFIVPAENRNFVV